MSICCVIVDYTTNVEDKVGSVDSVLSTLMFPSVDKVFSTPK